MFINKYIKTDFVRNVFTLTAGTFVAQLIPLLLYPVLSRLYTPEDFALFALYFSIISVLDVVSTGRYELTVILPKSDTDSINIIAGALLYGLLFSVVSLMFFIFWGDWLGRVLNNNKIVDWLYLIPVSLFFVSVSKLLSNWLIRKKAFKQSSINKVVQRASEGTISLGFGAMKFSNGLIFGDFTGRFFLMIISLYQSIKTGLTFNIVNWKTIKINLSFYKKFPLYNSIPALLNGFSSLLPVFIISAYYSEATTGYFNFSRQLLVVPIALMSVSISQVLFQQIAEKKNNGKAIGGDIRSLTGKLAILALLFIVVLFFGAPFIFKIIFGSKWIISGEYTQILVFSYAIQFIVMPLSIIFPALNKIKTLSIWQISYFAAICALFFFHNLPVYQFLIVYSLIDIVAYSIYYYLIIRTAMVYDKSIS